MSTSHQQKIGVITATIVGMNAMIGAGIFSVPASLAANVGPAGILTYIFVVIAVWLMGISIARLGELYPQEGSFYTYTKQWGGHLMGLISAGSYLIGLVIAMGLLTQMAGNYLHTPLPFLSPYSWGLITLASLTLLNMMGVTFSQIGQFILIGLTVFPLLVTIVIGLSNAHLANLHPFMPYGLTNILAATRAVIFGFFGFECAASLFNIVKNPERNVPRALTYAIVLVGILYIVFVASLILSVPLWHFADPTIPLSQTLKGVFPHHRWLMVAIHISILSAIIGTIHSMIWSAGALLVSYLRQFKSPLLVNLVATGALSESRAVFIIGCLILISFLTFRNLDLFFSLTALFIIFSFATSMITLLTLKSEWQSKQNIKTIIGLLTAGVIFSFALEGLLQALAKL